MLLEHPFHYLSGSKRQVSATLVGQRVQIIEHFLPLIPAEVASILRDQFGVVALSDCLFVLVVEVAAIHLRHKLFSFTLHMVVLPSLCSK